MISYLIYRHEIEILLGDRVLPYNMTVYQAVKQFGQCDEERDAEDDHGVLGRPSIWVATHTIWYGLIIYYILYFISLLVIRVLTLSVPVSYQQPTSPY